MKISISTTSTAKHNNACSNIPRTTSRKQSTCFIANPQYKQEKTSYLTSMLHAQYPTIFSSKPQ